MEAVSVESVDVGAGQRSGVRSEAVVSRPGVGSRGIGHGVGEEAPAVGPFDRLFPGGVRLWHFIVIPVAAMGLLIVGFRGLDALVLERLGRVASDVYLVARLLGISALMAGLIAWLAFRHRREFEARIAARQRALEDTRDFLSGIIEASGEAIVTRDAEGKVTSWNRAAEEIFGWSVFEMLGRGVEWLLPPEPQFRDDFERNQARVRAGKTVRDHETTRICRDGRRVTVRVTRAPLYDTSGRFAGSTGIIRDVTAVKEMEALLLERERLAAVGEMSAQVAHEIKNPLTGIRGACEILAEEFTPEHPRRAIAEEVVRQMNRLNTSVEDLLLFARPKPLQPVATNLHVLLDRVVSVLLGDPRARGVEFRKSCDPDVPLIHADASQIEQVFFNIILNALQAMDFDGVLTITTAADRGEVRVVVRDSGPGISPELAERVFKPFFTTRSQGTGLGLAIVKNIVRSHGGSIRAGTGKDGGGEVVVSLPLRTVYG